VYIDDSCQEISTITRWLYLPTRIFQPMQTIFQQVSEVSLV